MPILAIVGSPHNEGLSNGLVDAAVKGALSAPPTRSVPGPVTVNKIHATDYDWGACLDCEYKTCWSDLSCRHSPLPAELNDVLNQADGLILAAPVYFLDANGLTRNLLDRLRPGPNVNGLPALGISMAGGTGRGCVLALQMLYHFFFCIWARPIQPLPVTRFNYQQALEQAEELGCALARAPKRPFSSLAERMGEYDGLPLMDLDLVGENFFLLETILANTIETAGNHKRLACAQRDLQAASAAFAADDISKVTQLLERAYEAAIEAWQLAHK